jgi:hypothetical protein
MKITRNKKIVFAEFPNRKELTLTMGRLGEFYESAHKNIRNQKFTLEQFLDAFMDTDGNISYFNDWSGYNIPGNAVNNFLLLNSWDETKREADLLDEVDNVLWEGASDEVDAYSMFSSGDFYLIAFMKGDTGTIDHELCHALYYLDADYEKAANKLIKSVSADIILHMTEVLIKMGYNKAVCKDEINAYLSTSDAGYMKRRFDMDTKVANSVMKPFKELANTRLKEYNV